MAGGGDVKYYKLRGTHDVFILMKGRYPPKRDNEVCVFSPLNGKGEDIKRTRDHRKDLVEIDPLEALAWVMNKR